MESKKKEPLPKWVVPAGIAVGGLGALAMGTYAATRHIGRRKKELEMGPMDPGCGGLFPQAILKNRYGDYDILVPLVFLFFAPGSRGDVENALLVSKQLIQRGHTVHMVLDKRHFDYVKNSGIERVYDSLLDEEKAIKFLVSFSSGKRNPYEMYKLFNEREKASFSVAEHAVETSLPDVILTNGINQAIMHVSEAFQIPYQVVGIQIMIPTPEIRETLFFGSSTPKFIDNMSTWNMREMARSKFSLKGANKFRKKHGLRQLSEEELFARDITKVPVPTTLTISDNLIPKGSTWGSHVTTTGFVVSEVKSAELDSTIVDFIADRRAMGDKVVFVSFGSVIMDDKLRKRIDYEVLQTTSMDNVSFIVQPGWAKIGIDWTPVDNVMILTPGVNVSHVLLFRLVDTVVTHGGAGTTTTALSAGAALVIVAFNADQFLFGEQIEKAGLGGNSLKASTLTSDKLKASIRASLTRAVQETVDAMRIALGNLEDNAQMAAENILRNVPMINPITWQDEYWLNVYPDGSTSHTDITMNLKIDPFKFDKGRGWIYDNKKFESNYRCMRGEIQRIRYIRNKHKRPTTDMWDDLFEL